jgi:choice-of-anchor B domain-containing protein
MKKPSMMFVTAALAVLLAVCWSSLSRAHEGEHHSPGGNGQLDNQPMAPMSLTPCVNGMAGTFPCRDIDLASFVPLSLLGGGTGNDIWGWTDPQSGKEYALLGRSSGISFVDISDPTNPVYLGNLPTHTVDSLWRGLKVYRNHVFVISEAADHGMQVFDLTRLRGLTSPQTFTETTHYNNFGSAHTLAINEATGFAYAAGSMPGAGRTQGVDTCAGATPTRGGGLHIIDVKNPSAPAFAGCVDQDGYTHETQCVIYRGPDSAHHGREVCFSSNEDTLTIVDVTNKSAPQQLSRTGYNGRGYTHQGWLTEDQTHFLLDDELDEQHEQQQQLPGRTKTFVWDVTNLDAPFLRSVFQNQTTSIDHNLYVRGRYAVQSNYRSGVRVIDAKDAPAGTLTEAAFFDVYPIDDQALFNGTWANYPFFASGTVIASGIEQGLFVLRPRVQQYPVKIDYSPFFIRQHYRDFLGREPDEMGLDFWTFEVARCVADANCLDERRVNASAAFFISIEFQQTGYLVHRFHAASFPGSLPRFQPFLTDLRRVASNVVVGAAGWELQLESNKQAFALEWVQRPEFVAQHPANLTGEQFVSALFTTAGVTPTAAERDAALAAHGAGGAEGRARALRSVADSGSVYNRHFNPAFVLMQYFGYLRRNPDDAPNTDLSGYNFWLNKLNEFSLPNEDVRNDGVALSRVRRADMVKSFLVAGEYRGRFGQ